ncbi:MAG: DUF255 domain-containing protein [Armatimonadetes bacterium]|nr:DUF255 domain-containing protein [Armatimonadota bacterium]
MSYTNRLIDEKSPYLQQHAHNPVDWYPWGDDAFEKARREGKPVFLSVGYSTCHWCHVMERESFENESIARVLNEHFVSIKVDREERPDVDQVYMDAVQATTGRGGWPMSAFLLPDGRPFFGGTYFPPEQFRRLLEHVARTYCEHRSRLEHDAQEIAQAVAGMMRTSPRGTSLRLDRGIVKKALEVLHSQFDAEHGGFGGAPKFPPHTALRLLLHEYRAGGDEGLWEMARVTLEKMALGGLHDHIGGGFHRYATDDQWLLPHFEKMLYDNALLARNYLEAYALTRDPFYREVTEGIFGWVTREMTSPEGAFYCALDADSEGVEGRYYVWSRAEVEEVLGADSARAFCDAYQVETGGNYREETTGERTGMNVLRLAARASGLNAEREKLLEVRARRVPPNRDDKVLSGWNGLMIAALAEASRVFEEPEYAARAARAARFVLGEMWSGSRLLRRWRDGEAKGEGYLDDYMYLAEGLLALYGVTGNSEWSDYARVLAEAALERFWDREEGGFFYSEEGTEELFVRPKEALDHPLPSGNGTAALVLIGLAEQTPKRHYRQQAERVLQAMAPWMEHAPYGTDTLVLATSVYLGSEENVSKEAQAMETAGESQGVSAERHPVKITARPSKARVAPGEEFEIEVRVEIEKGWHVNSRRPTVDFLLPSAVGLREGGPFEAGETAYPEDRIIQVGEDQLAVYEGTVLLKMPVSVLKGAAPGAGSAGVVFQFQACDDQMCQGPDRVDVDVPIEIMPA